MNHNKYPTLMFGKNKLDKGSQYLEQGIQPIFVFKCYDGVWYWKQNLAYTLGYGGRSDRGLNEYNDMIYVDVNEFMKLESLHD